MNSVVYQVESIKSVIDDGKELFKKHYDEIALNKDDIPLDPDYAAYLEMDKWNKLFVMTARDKGVLIGYAIFFVNPSPHYKTTLFAVNDILFIDKAYRKTGVGLGLIKECEAELFGYGVNKILWHVKLAHDFGPLLFGQGYSKEETVWGKILKD